MKKKIISLTAISRIVGKYIYLENGKWVLHDNGCDKIAVAIKDYLIPIKDKK